MKFVLSRITGGARRSKIQYIEKILIKSLRFEVERLIFSTRTKVIHSSYAYSSKLFRSVKPFASKKIKIITHEHFKNNSFYIRVD